MIKGYDRWRKVKNIVSHYHAQREMCRRFLETLPEKLSGNEYEASVQLGDEGAVQITVLGEIVRLSFDYIIKDDVLHGLVAADQMFTDQERNRLLHTISTGMAIHMRPWELNKRNTAFIILCMPRCFFCLSVRLY